MTIVDDSFKKPGAIPFKWEIRPGVPKTQHQHVQEKQHKQLSPPTLPSPAEPFYHHRPSPFPSPHPKLKPPPAGSIFLSSPEPRTRSFRSSPRMRSERWRFEHPAWVQAECVSPGCFPSPLRKESKRRTNHFVDRHETEHDYSSEGGHCQAGSHFHRSVTLQCRRIVPRINHLPGL